MIKRNYEKFKARQLPGEIGIISESGHASDASLPSVPDSEKEDEIVTNPLINDMTASTGGSSSTSS